MKQLPKAKMIKTLARLRPGADLADPATGRKQALRSLARRQAGLDQDIKDLHRPLTELDEAGRAGTAGAIRCGRPGGGITSRSVKGDRLGV